MIKDEFIKDEMFTLSWSAAVGRSKTYTSKTNEKACFWQVIPKEMVNKFEKPVIIEDLRSA